MSERMQMKRVLIMGAAGKDFHVFNTCYRNKADVRVVCFTATQIPNIDGRRYPPELAGDGYPDGIPIEPEERLEELIKLHSVDEVVFAYSDVTLDYVRDREMRVIGQKASFLLAPTKQLTLKSKRPVVAVCAVRTGCGKSQTSRHIVGLLRARDKRTVVVRHPMPYGDLLKQRVQRFATLDDLTRQECSIEEREEYEPHIENGATVFAGVDMKDVLDAAEKEADVIIWDGGNNDVPFYRPDLWIVVVDPLRAGHELTYYPSLENFEGADVIVINKIDSARESDLRILEENIAQHNPSAKVVRANSPVHVSDVEKIKGKRVLVIEDGPTLTHGGMKFGAGLKAARENGASQIVDPKGQLVGSLAEIAQKYPDLGPVLPAIGYGEDQIRELEETIAAVDCDTVVIGTPVDLALVLKIPQETVRVTYRLEVIGEPTLEQILDDFLKTLR
ncbi:MAG: GTPase [Planctomycetota bacterium]|nr:GTPase [Planctomycetota bacterium]